MRLITFIATATCALFSACGTIDSVVDCHAICARYADCYDGAYDVAACESRCRSHSSSDTTYRHSADECNACITDRPCTTATFACTTQCGSVVP